MTKHYVLIDDAVKCIEAMDHLCRHELIAYDTETTGLNVRKEKIIGLSFTGEVGVGYYYPILVYNVELDKNEYHPFYSEKDLQVILAKLKTKKLIMHNGSFDIRITMNDLKVSLINALYADTVLMEHTLNEEGPFGLKEICINKAVELGLDDQDAANQEQLELEKSVIARGGSWTSGNKQMYKAELSILAKYAAADVDMTLRLFNYNSKRLDEEELTNLFYIEEAMPLYKFVTIKMEHRGVHIAMKRLDELSIKILDEIYEYEKVVVDSLISTPEFNDFITAHLTTNYPPSVKGNFAQEVCRFGKLDLPVTNNGKLSITKKTIAELPDSIYKSFLLSGEVDYIPEGSIIEIQRNLHRKTEDSQYLINIASKAQLRTLVFDYLKVKPLSTTEKGSPQFNDAFVESIAKTYEWANKIRVYNKLNKIKSSYLDRFKEHTEDGIYYPTFKQHGTTSARYASDFQQLPRPKDEDSDEDPLVKEFSDCIRELVIPAFGYDFIDVDYDSLEPRCVDGNSIVHSYKNGLLRIKDLKIGDSVLTKDGFREVMNSMKSEKPSLKIITKKGVVICSEDHKLFVNNQWTRASEINIGDVLEEYKFDYEGSSPTNLPVYLKNATNKPFATKSISEEEAWMLGAFLGDGVYSFKSKYVGVCGVLEDGVLEKFINIFKEYGLVEVKCRDKRAVSNMQTHTYNNIELVQHFINTYGVASKDGKVMRVPTYILNAKEDIKLAFLAGVIDTDGSYNNKKSQLSISSKFPEFLSELITLGNTLGLDGRFNLAHSKKFNKKCYEIRFTACSINKLYKLGLAKFQVVDRKRLYREVMIGKKESPKPIVIEIVKTETIEMIDISVKDNHEFICDNLRVHNCFADDAGDAALIKIFTDNLDMYSVIAIGAENITDATADKKSPDFLKKKYPLRRQNAKAYALGIRYGMKAFKLSKTLDISVEEAQTIIDNYFKAFPGLKKSMDKYLHEVKTTGKVTSKFGRVRHLPRAKAIYEKFGDAILDYNNLRKISQKTYIPIIELKLIRKEYNNLLNNALNFPIQSTATSILTRACVAMSRRFIEEKIDAWVSLSIHDQVVVSCNKKDTVRAKQIIQDCMENTTKLTMPLVAIPAVGTNLRDAH